jgi:hypothetical protein
MFGNKFFRRIFVSETEEIVGGWRKFHNLYIFLKLKESMEEQDT